MPPEKKKDEVIRWQVFDMPLGRTYAATSERGLCRLSWRVSDDAAFEADLAQRFPGRPTARDAEGLEEVGVELGEYFAGQRRSFDVAVDLSRLGSFKASVLEATRRVPFGFTVTYSEVARRIGRPKSARAVGNALRANPVPIVVPCHRVVRADGSLGGFDGPNGTAEKRHLLLHERNEP